MKNDRWKIVKLLPALLYTILIFYLSHQSNPFPIKYKGLFTYDKIIHMIEYGIFAFLWWFALKNYILRKPLLHITILIWSSLYGISDEIHQSFIPGRYCSVYDWFADLLGITISLLIITKWLEKQ